ncbi:MAG: tetratricopeptide repeat protein [Coleofasciculus sp. B1-GNL1-01]|uniref:caspase, EACC1-associated type n=1 Tax=Coleofasciculus sp. B1-GNL1-01 TaxID=3068484 RepID=UPI0032F72565
MAKLALLIGISQYEFGLDPLPGSIKDVQAMEKVLRHPERGGFDAVEVITNPDPQQMREKIEALFADCHKDDLLLLYFSGHGITDNRGKLYLTSPTTKKTRLAATAIPSDFVHSLMLTSPSRKQVMILDCCFSGAFAKGMTAKADAAVLTSSGLLEYSQSGTDLSLYTRFLVEGMETGAADLNKDGIISVDELHEYAKEKIVQCSTEIKPEIYPFKEGHKLSLTQTSICFQEPLLPIFTPPSFPDFYGRQTELEQVKKLLQASPVVILWGESGVGKTYLAAQLAHQLSNDYKVCWLDKEELTLEELLLQVNEFLKSNGEYGFVTTYAEDKITSTHKIPTLVQVISTSKLAKYAFFIDGFQIANHSEIEPFIQRFRTHGGKNRLILIDHSPEQSLGVWLASRVHKFNVAGFQYEEAVKYINQRCQASGIECSLNDVIAVIEKTAGHPLAIDLVIQWYSLLGNSMGNLLHRLVEYDKRYGAELNKRLLENVAIHLDETEREALSRLSVFRTPVQRSAWTYLDISESVGESLLQRRLLTRVDCDKFQMHPLIAEFWRTSQSEEEMVYWQEKVAHYYWQQGKQSPLETLDRRAYLDSYYHWCKIGQLETAAQVLNDLVGRSHEKERLLSERLTGLGEWLLNLDDAIFVDKPWLLLEKGRKLEKQGSAANAEEIFKNAYEIFEQQGNQLGASVALYYVGKMRHLRGQPELALQALKSVLEIAESQADFPMQIRTLGKMIGCYTDLGQCDNARNVANTADALATRSDDQLGLALILYRQGSIERHQSNFLEAEEFFNDSAKKFAELGDIYRESKSWARLGICQKSQSKLKKAEDNLKHAIELKQSINDRHGEARDLDYLADIYTHLGRYEEAEKSYRESLNIKEGKDGIQPDVYGQIKTYNNLARIALLTGRLDKADELLQESKKRIDQQNKRYIGVNGSRLIIQGDLQFNQGEYEAALQSYTEAAACFTSPNPEVPSSYARVLFCFGQTYLTLGNLSLAKQYLEDSLARFHEYRMRYYEAHSLTHLARLTALINSHEEAYNQNQEAISIAKDINAQSIVRVCLETQGKIEENKILSSFNFGEQEKNTKDLIASVWRCYDDAIEAIHELTGNKNINRQIAQLQVHKKLWLFTVKHLCKEAISDDDAYGLLQTEKLPQDVIYIELLNFKYTLGILNSISSGLASRIADCALSIISPLAMRFGFNELREELEERALAFLHPDEYEEINQALESRFPQREDFIENLTSDLESLLEEAKIQAEIFPRAKTIYSIYKKSKARKVSLDKILDIIGVRIITQTESECYKVLAIVQEMGKFFQGEGILKESLRDYIKHPKITGYQSIHINIRYGEPQARIVEFQIRTHRMHLAAEVGIGVLGLDQAAHCRYKDPASYARPLSKRNYELAQSQRLNLVVKCQKESVITIGNIIRSSKFELLSVDLDKFSDQRIILQLNIVTKSRRYRKEKTEINQAHNQLVETINEIPNCEVVNDKNKESELKMISMSIQDKALLLQELTRNSSDLDKFIYLITPKNDVKKLQKGATPIDFAYRIHTDLGNHCAGARVNGQMVTLDTSLKTGDIVEIITNKNSHPNLGWLQFVKTSSARNRIRQWYKRSHWQENIDHGRELLQKELGKDGLETLLESEAMKDVVEQCNYHSVDDLLANLGYGELSLNRVANRIREATNNKKLIDNTPELSTTPPTILHTVNISSSKSAIAGIEGLGYHLAHCCNPVPGEPIIGVVKLAGRGISVHTQECHNWDNVPDDRLIEVSWNNTEGQTYPIYIQVEVCDDVGVLNNITSLLKDLKINIRDIRMDRYADKTAMIYLCIDIYDHKQIQRIFSQIKKLKGYLSVRRSSQV